MGAGYHPDDWLRRARERLGAAVSARPLLTRWILAGPGAILAALATMAVMPLWLPRGAAGVTNLAFPIILAPLIWAAAFFYACLEENLARGSLVIGALVLVQVVVALVAVVG